MKKSFYIKDYEYELWEDGTGILYGNKGLDIVEITPESLRELVKLLNEEDDE